MTRIAPAGTPDLESADSGERLQRQAAAIFNHRPETTKVLVALFDTFGKTGNGTLSPRLLELVRLRIAFWNQCRSCITQRLAPDLVDENLVCSLEKPEESSDLTPEEKVAVRFADLLATDHLAIDDDLYDELRRYFAEDEIVELGMFCAASIGFGRLSATWRLTEDPDEKPQGELGEMLTPWPGVARR